MPCPEQLDGQTDDSIMAIVSLTADTATHCCRKHICGTDKISSKQSVFYCKANYYLFHRH